MNGFSVLVIDDDIWMQRILSKTLQSFGFKNVFLASNGFDGINLAVENKPNLIILDILMPELSGQITLKVLKNIGVTKTIPILMVSALSDTENLGLAVKSGSSGFISKPFTRATIYDKLIGIFGKETIDALVKGQPIPDNSFPTESTITLSKNEEDDNLLSMEITSSSSTSKENLNSIKKFLQKVGK